MPIVYLFPIAEESRELMEQEHQAVLRQLRDRYPCSEYRKNVRTVDTGGFTGPAWAQLREEVPAAVEVQGILHQASDIVDTVTACLQEKGVKYETPQRFNAF